MPYTNYAIWKLYTPESNGNYLLAHILVKNSITGWWDHHLWRTKNANDANPNNVTWEELPLPYNAWISDIAFDENNVDIMHLAFSSFISSANSPTGSQMLYRIDYSNPNSIPQYTCPSGLCQDLTYNLPNTGVGTDAFKLEKGSDGAMYIATDVGVYYTNNKFISSGMNWQILGAELPHTSCNGLEINYTVNKIRVGLNGRGSWEHSLFCPSDYDLAFTTSNSSNLSNTFQEAENNITITANSGNINLTNFIARAGSEIVITATGSNEVVIGPNSDLFIHACNHSGNSFRQQNNYSGGSNTNNNNDIEKPITQSDNFKFTYYPNPFTDHLHIDFLLDKSSRVLASVYNAQGQLIETLAKRDYQAGEYTLEFYNISIKPGVYFVRLDIGDKHYTKAVLKIVE